MQIFEIQFGTPEFDAAVRLRYELLRKPLGMEFAPEQFDSEYAEHHLAAFNDHGKLVGYLNLTPKSKTQVKMRQVAVDPACQGLGIGTAMVAASEEMAIGYGYQTIVLHAREPAVPFYLRLGYTKIGKRFEEVSIPHFKMKKNLGGDRGGEQKR